MSAESALDTRSLMRAARIAGALWLISVAAGIYAEVFVRGSLIVHGNAVATAVKIAAAEPMYRAGLAADLVGDMAYLGATILLYVILKPAGRTMSLIMWGFGLAGCAVMAANLVVLFAPITLLSSYGLSSGSGSGMLPLVLVCLRLHSIGYSISIALFSIQVAAMGCLILRSPYFHWIFGVLFLIEAVCNTISSFGGFLAVGWVERLGNVILIPGLPAEAGFAAWLLLFGVNGFGRRMRTT